MNLKIYLLLSAAVLVTACDHRMLQDDESPECELSEDCPDFPWYNCKEGSCVHKDVFPIFPIEIVGLIIFCMFMALANVAGVGGGGVAIPLIMAFFHFKTKKAIAISSFTILCCTTARFVCAKVVALYDALSPEMRLSCHLYVRLLCYNARAEADHFIATGAVGPVLLRLQARFKFILTNETLAEARAHAQIKIRYWNL